MTLIDKQSLGIGSAISAIFVVASVLTFYFSGVNAQSKNLTDYKENQASVIGAVDNRITILETKEARLKETLDDMKSLQIQTYQLMLKLAK